MSSDPGFPAVELERRGPVAHVWLNRPDMRNAMNDEMMDSLPKLFRLLQKDDSVRVVVLGGRGTAFCAGADLGRMDKAGRAKAGSNRAQAMRSAKFFHELYVFPKPTIARIHGPAFAGGLGLVCACDVVVASIEAVFCLPETRIGLVPAMISPYVTRAIGANAARRYLVSAERFSAEEAHRLGMVHELVAAADLDACVERVAQAFVACAPGAVAEAKKLLRKVIGAPIASSLVSYTAGVLAQRRASDEAREGIAAFKEKRKPAWQ